MLKFIHLLFFLLPLYVVSQSVKVLDVETKKPIENVVFVSKTTSKQYVSNKKGVVSHPLKGDFNIVKEGYQKLLFSFSGSLKRSVKVYLTPEAHSLKEVVLSYSRWYQDRAHIPRKLLKVEKDEIEANNPQTSADLLAKTGSVFVQKSQQGGGSPLIRGFAANRLLIAVDGVRMNNAIFRGGNIQNLLSIDPLSLADVEVVLGPGSVVNGSDAIGGVMHFKTVRPLFSAEKNFEVKGQTLYRFSSANQEQTAHANFNLGFKKWGLATSFSYNSFDDLRQGTNGPKDFLRNEYVDRVNNTDVVKKNSSPNKQFFSGYKQYNFLQKLRFRPLKNLSFSLTAIYTETSDYDRYDRLQRRDELGDFKHSEWFYGPQKWLFLSKNIYYKKQSFFFNSFKIKNTYQNFKESRNVRDFGSDIRKNTSENVDTYTLNIDFKKKWGHFTFNYGLEYIHNWVNSSASNFNIVSKDLQANFNTRYPDGSTWQSLAGFLVTNLEVNERLRLSSGVRYNHILLDAKFGEIELNFPFNEVKINTGGVTGGIGAAYQLSDYFILRGNANTAFRAPNIDDVSKIVTGSEPGKLIVPNPNLKSEYAYNTEFSVDYEQNDRKVSLSGYYTFLDNALTRNDFTLNGQSKVIFEGELSNVQAIQNSNSLYVYGLELGAEIPIIKNVLFKGNYTITKGKERFLNKNETVPVRHVPPNFGDLHLIYKKDKLSVDAFLNFNEGFSNDQLAPSEKGKREIYAKDANGNLFLPSWYTVNVNTRYKFNSKISLSIALENFTDQRYRTYSSGISAPGINFVTSLNYNF